jgi:hypothetical protein
MLSEFIRSQDGGTPTTAVPTIDLFDLRTDPYLKCRQLFLASGSAKKRKFLESNGDAFETSAPGNGGSGGSLDY